MLFYYIAFLCSRRLLNPKICKWSIFQKWGSHRSPTAKTAGMPDHSVVHRGINPQCQTWYWFGSVATLGVCTVNWKSPIFCGSTCMSISMSMSMSMSMSVCVLCVRVFTILSKNAFLTPVSFADGLPHPAPSARRREHRQWQQQRQIDEERQVMATLQGRLETAEANDRCLPRPCCGL